MKNHKQLACLGIVPLVAALFDPSAGYAQTETERKPDAQVEVAAGESEMPELIHFKEHYDWPLFVAAERVFLASGEVDPELFQAPIARGIIRLLNLPRKGGCVSFDYITSLDQPPSDRAHLADALRNSDNVILAVVTGRRYGFWEDRPGSLLRIATEEVLKGSPLRDINYLFFAVGNFQVNNVKLCIKNPNFGPLPGVDERVIVMFDDNFFNDGSELLGVGPTGIVTLKRGEPVGLPKHFRKTDWALEGISADAFLSHAHEQLREESQR